MTKSWQISRRSLLRGAGASLALPWLDAFADSAAPVRMAVLYMPNGVNPHHWTPKGEGADYECSRILKPLDGLRSEFSVLSGLHNANAHTGDGHYVKTAGFLTGQTISKTTGSDIDSGGISMDQLAAERLADQVRVPSIELGIDPIAGGVDRIVGYTQLYGSHIAWRSRRNPLPCQLNPQHAFQRLFSTNVSELRKGFDAQISILDRIREDARAMHERLGKADQGKLDEYLEAVRDVERRVQRDAVLQTQESKLDPQARAQIETLRARVDGFAQRNASEQAYQVVRSGDHTDYVRLMLDILVLALWTDSTRVATFMFGRAVSGKDFSFLNGVSGGFHELSHHENKAEKLKQYARINTWHTQQFAYFLERMKSIREGERSLLDNSMILFGSSLRDGNKHQPDNLPLILAGRGGGALNPGRHITFPERTPLCNLYVSMLGKLGTPVEHFADSTGPLENI
ncbi:MAG: hypothetical protein ACI8W8_000158 [Rhodothermales bacterium]|jgi:hypothetical protein